MANPFSSFSPLIYRLGWVEELWLFLLFSANGGPIPSSQSEHFVGKVGAALELIPTSAVWSVVTLSNAQPGSWAQGTSRQELSCPSQKWLGEGVCLRCLMWSNFEFPGPNWARRYLGRGLRSKYEDDCMTCYRAWARGTQVQGLKPCIGGPIPIQ